MATESEVMFSHDSNPIDQARQETKAFNKDIEEKKEKFYAVIFLSTVTGMSALVGFGTKLAYARKQDPKCFNEGLSGCKGLQETGASLALRALGWGTFSAVSGCAILFYSIWKILGVKNTEEFRNKMSSFLSIIPKNNTPQSRTEFESITDLLTYLANDWDKKKN